MAETTTIGLDIAKNVFQFHSVDAQEQVVLCRALHRTKMAFFFAKLPTCLIGMEACATAHHWGTHADGVGARGVDLAGRLRFSFWDTTGTPAYRDKPVPDDFNATGRSADIAVEEVIEGCC